MLDLFLTLVAAATAACAIPADLTSPPAQPQEESRIVPVTKLVLAYYWWPQECRRDDAKGTPACAAAGSGFRVHGLWPDGAGKTYPQFCRAPTPLDVAEVRRNYCMTPSTSLLQHEWAKHGTCHWDSAAAYFGDERKVAATITLPDIAVATAQTAGAIRDAFVAANPALPRGSLFVATDKNQWLTEVRVCLMLADRPTACEGGDIGAPDSVPVRVWPR